MRVALQEIECGENHARCADTTLRASMGKEGLLHGVKLLFGSDSLDGANSCALSLERRDQTAVDQHAVDFDCARSAFAFPAAFLCAGQVRLLTENVKEPGHRKSFQIESTTIHDAVHANFVRRLSHARFPEFRARLPV